MFGKLDKYSRSVCSSLPNLLAFAPDCQYLWQVWGYIISTNKTSCFIYQVNDEIQNNEVIPRLKQYEHNTGISTSVSSTLNVPLTATYTTSLWLVSVPNVAPISILTLSLNAENTDVTNCFLQMFNWLKDLPYFASTRFLQSLQSYNTKELCSAFPFCRTLDCTK